MSHNLLTGTGTDAAAMMTIVGEATETRTGIPTGTGTIETGIITVTVGTLDHVHAPTHHVSTLLSSVNRLL